MAKLALATALLALASIGVGPAPNDEKPTPQPCVILKRMGPADEVTSRLYSFGFRGKQFQYVEGKFPEGLKFHGRLTDNDVRKIQDAGGRVAILEQRYTAADLEGARRSCVAPTGTTDLISVAVKSAPDGADITVDGKFMGNTPSALRLAAGDHVILLQKPGFKPWQRTMSLTVGETPNISAALEPEHQQQQ